jgi:hypothetical protein
MAHILYYRGKGEKLMAGISEYIVIVDADKLTAGDKIAQECPGFTLHEDIEVDEDIHCLPCEEILIPKRSMLPAVPMPIPSILAKYEADLRLYESMLGPPLGTLILAMSILSDLQHMISEDPHNKEVKAINEAKALILRMANFILRP